MICRTSKFGDTIFAVFDATRSGDESDTATGLDKTPAAGTKGGLTVRKPTFCLCKIGIDGFSTT